MGEVVKPARPARKKKSPSERRKRFITLLAGNANVSRSAQVAGIASSTLYRWRKDNQKFAEEWDRALGEALDDLEGVLMQRAKKGVVKPVFYGGKAIGEVTTYSDQLAMFLLKSRRPEVYDRERVDLPPCPPADVLHAMSEDEVAAEIARRLDVLSQRGLPATNTQGDGEN